MIGFNTTFRALLTAAILLAVLPAHAAGPFDPFEPFGPCFPFDFADLDIVVLISGL